MSDEEFDTLAAQLTVHERRFFVMAMRNMVRERKAAMNGELNFKAIMRDGGVMDSYKEIRAREK